MADFKYERDKNPFLCLGMDLNRPVDRLKPMKQAILKNVRSSHLFGRLEPRPGLATTSLAGSHSIRRLNDPATLTGTRVTGHGVNLYVGGVQVDTGYSGNPLALVPHRPSGSPKAWMYVADSSRMRKVDVPGNVHNIGLPAPLTPPTVALANNSSTGTFYKEIDDGDATTGWAADTTIVASMAATATPRVNVSSVTITAVLYDSGTTGWCSVRPSTLLNIGEGTFLEIETGQGDAEQVMVQSVHPGSPSTTIDANGILFDSGTDGACSIILSTQYEQIQIDSLLVNTSDANTYAHVTGIFKGKEGQTCIRAVAATGSTWVAGDTVYAVPSFRCYTANTAEATDTLKAVGVAATFSATAGTGNITKDIHSSPIDLTTIATGVPAIKDDYIHVSLRFSAPLVVEQCRLMFDVTNQASAASAFQGDYYYKTFRPGDLTPSAVAGATITQLSAEQRALQRQQIADYEARTGYSASTPWNTYYTIQQQGGQYQLAGDFPGVIISSPNVPPPDVPIPEDYVFEPVNPIYPRDYYVNPLSGEGALGSTWQELRFRVSDLIRVGTNIAADLSAVYYIRLEFIVSAGALVVDFHSMGLLGGHGPDCGAGVEGNVYYYRYRARCTSTGSRSNWSPASRNGIYSRRQLINAVAPAQYTAATEADVLEFQRFGGTLLEWHYVGQVANSASPVTLADNVPDDVAAVNSGEGQVNYQPWPVIGLPVSGTTTSVCGTSVVGSSFSTSWAPGTRIEINNYVYTIYQVVSTTRIELFESAGAQGAVAWRIQEPVVVSQPLYAFWGPLDNVMFACGDPINPQRLYFTQPGSEGTTDTSYIDITSPSEPLQNGVIYNGRAYVWSSERLFQVVQGGGAKPWDYVEIPDGRGLWAKWAFTGCQAPPGPYMCFLSKDGIYMSDGGAARSMTQADLNPLFPNEGNMGITTNTILRPYMDSSYGAHFRLSYYDGHMYFDYSIVS